MTDLKRIAVVPGDGIGPEVIDAGLAMLKAATEKRGRAFEWVHKDWGAEKWLREGVGIPEGGLKDLEENYDAVYFGALGDRFEEPGCLRDNPWDTWGCRCEFLSILSGFGVPTGRQFGDILVTYS